MNTLALTPLLRHSVGFDRFNQLFDTLTKAEESAPSYPPYNIEKTGEDSYIVTLAVAGFSEDDLTITQEGDALTVRGRIEKKSSEAQSEYLHKGIATRSFERTFSLADHVKVLGAELENGLLQVTLQREIPEAKKPRSIAINGSEKAKRIAKK